VIECRLMNLECKVDALNLLSAFLRQDEYYLDSSSGYGDGGVEALETALQLFLEHPEIGFVWMAYDEHEPVALCVVCFAISTSIGGVVAKLDDVFVKTGRQGKGIGTTLLEQLKGELAKAEVRRIDTSVHLHNEDARRFYLRHGFRPLNEERLACVL
jgi:GNAT superfamily N-acetyltransferase